MATLNYCEIRNKGYGQKWQHFKLYYVGPRPKLLRQDGAFSSGKSLLEALAAKFKAFELILTPEESRIHSEASSQQVYLALPELREMNGRLFSQKKEVTQRAVSSLLAALFPKHFAGGHPVVRAARRARSRALKPRPTLRLLRQLAKDLKQRLQANQSARTWQKYLQQQMLFLQPGYIELIPKAKVGGRGPAFPDWFLITCDDYLDLLEIKTPGTALLSYDPAHQQYGWSPEIEKALAQVGTSLQAVAAGGDQLRQKVKTASGLELRAIKPRGIIFAGHSRQWAGNKARQEAFGRLNQALQHVTVVTYDELLTRLQNHITALRGVQGQRP